LRKEARFSVSSAASKAAIRDLRIWGFGDLGIGNLGIGDSGIPGFKGFGIHDSD
jgi:hypothetical protein